MPWTVFLVVAVVALGLGILLLGAFDPLTARLGLRNVMRHRRQTLTVILGLLAGTAVISASLVAGDSLESGLRTGAIDALGETDVIIRVPGNLYLPRSLLDEVVAPPLHEDVAGTAAIIVEQAAVTHLDEDLFEPTVVVQGFDATESRAFGAFVDPETGERFSGADLGPDEVYLNARLADKLRAEAGDSVRLSYRQAIQPFVPRIAWMNATLTAATASPDGAGGYTYTHSPDDTYRLTVPVPPGAVGILAVAAWQDPQGTTDLDLELIAPDGRSFRATNGSAGPAAPAPSPLPLPPGTTPPAEGPENPAMLFVDRDNMSAGTWTFEVHGKNALNQFYTSFVAVLVPEYDLERAASFFDDLRERFSDGLADEIDPTRRAGIPHEADFTVRRVVAMEEKGVFFNADAVFMQRATAERLYDVPGQSNWLKVTNRGGPVDGMAATDAVVSFFEERIDALRASPDVDHAAIDQLEVRPLKQEFVESTEEAASLFTQFLTLIGSFTLIAGVMLIVNIFSMLAEERRHELGIARAVGLTRRRLILAFSFEGALYTLAASALGVLVGMGLAAVLVWGIDSLAPPDSLFRIPYTIVPASLAIAFSAGALITFATVLFASWRGSRLNIVRAIRDLDGADEAAQRATWPRILLLGVLVGATLLGITAGSHLAWVMGPPLIAFAMAPLLGAGRSDSPAWTVAAVVAGAYILASLVLVRGPDTLEREIATVARGVLLVIAATVVLVRMPAGPRAVAWLLSRSQRFAPVAMVATTYPLHRRFRTGLTLSMYALVIFVIVVFSVFFTIFTPDITRETGGYEVMGESQVAVQDLEAVDGVAALSGTDADPFLGVAHHDMLVERSLFGRDRVLIEGEPPPFSQNSARFFGFDATFAEANAFPLYAWDTRHGQTPAEVYAAVAADPELVLVSYSMVADPAAKDGLTHGPGATLTLNLTGGSEDRTIAGIMEQTFFGGIWMQKEETMRLFPDHNGFYLFRLESGQDPRAAAERIERAFRPIGMDADDVETEAAEFEAESTRIFQLFQAYLGLGLIVGVASIGIVTARAVLERRREIGMLKAIGFTKQMVQRAFLAEVLFMLFVAAFIGLVTGLAVAWAIWVGQLSHLPGLDWTIPWGRIAQMLGLALVATVIATLWPARRAAQVPAAEALRTVE